MKRTFYSSFILINRLNALFFAATIMCSVIARAQGPTYSIQFPFAPPPTSDPTMDRNDNPVNGFFLGIVTGVKFYVTVPGNVIGMRFYKGDLVAGSHEARIFRHTDSVLLTAPGGTPGGYSFGTTVPGWNQVLFPEAEWIHMIPGGVGVADTFVAAVYNNVGDYASTPAYWAGGADFGTNPNPIRVLITTNVTPGNGVSLYTNNGNDYPNTTNNAQNFWVDVLFFPDPPLPVSFTDFKATTANSDILLSWKTQSEQNNRGFEIQRSNNGADWYAVSFVNGAGESTIARNYNYADKGLAPGLYYYRLKQVDNDGKSKNSPVVTGTVSGKGRVLLFQNSPNPLRGSATIRYDLPTAQKVRLSLIDILGREVKVLTDKLSEAGSHIIPVDGTGLSRHLYYIRLQTESGTLTRNMLVE